MKSIDGFFNIDACTVVRTGFETRTAEQEHYKKESIRRGCCGRRRRGRSASYREGD